MKSIFSSEPIDKNNGIGIVRIVVGLMLMYHGHEIFRPELMKGYLNWDPFKSDFGKVFVYLGKGGELVSGILLVLGLFTRIACAIIIVTFVYITFFIGGGRFWYEDQHPFMFLLCGVLFLYTGPGAWSIGKSINR